MVDGRAALLGTVLVSIAGACGNGDDQTSIYGSGFSHTFSDVGGNEQADMGMADETGDPGDGDPGDGDPGDGDPGDGDPGDGDPSGDGDPGDGDPGDGDPSGDGDPGDGDPSGDGDGDPQPGPACTAVGSTSYPGVGGPATSNQNCPQTDFYLNVANAPGPIVDLDISLDGEAADTSQTRLWLISPQNVEVMLFNRRGGPFTDDWVGTYFDDQSPTPVATAPGPFHGCFSPEGSLAVFNGQDPTGSWILRVETCLFAASVTSWSLHVDY